MVLCDQCYPMGLAFTFLEDVINAFHEELKREFGTFSIDYQSRVDTIEKPYYFIHFDRTIKKLRDEYRDSNSSRSLHRLNQSLHQVSGIMQQNLDYLLLRGDGFAQHYYGLPYARHYCCCCCCCCSSQAFQEE